MRKTSKRRLPRHRKARAGLNRKPRPTAQPEAPESEASESPSEKVEAVKYAVMHPYFKILYVIPHLPQSFEEQSPLGWYTPGIHDAAGAICLAAALPADVRDAV